MLEPSSSYWRRATQRTAVLALVLLFAVPLVAKELRIQSFRSEVVVLPDGRVDVTEHLTLQFQGGPWHGIYREIPVEYAGPRGLNYSLFLDVRQVTGEDGRRLKFESNRERGYRKLKIFIPNADDSVQEVNIQYVVSDALRFFDDHDEFYWNITGDGWNIPIDSASAHIVLPTGATHVRANAFTGSFRSTARDASVQIVANGVDVQTTTPMGIHEGLTVAVAFDKGLVREPTSFDL
ncbi:MAG TPA: DUF2207 domain-containing protein, partial [Candidatus Acidoferrum sp.]|nr:DUF2207 domain-containing protein [Candidatus Acidoferrum sp.]